MALHDGFDYIWIDTCCIDKRNSELSESINSMHRWYQKADICYVYLTDTSKDVAMLDDSRAFNMSRWFTRGWTLQELLALTNLVFFSDDQTNLVRSNY